MRAYRCYLLNKAGLISAVELIECSGGRDVCTRHKQTAVLNIEGHDPKALLDVRGKRAGDARLYASRINAPGRHPGLKTNGFTKIVLRDQAMREQILGEIGLGWHFGTNSRELALG